MLGLLHLYVYVYVYEKIRINYISEVLVAFYMFTLYRKNQELETYDLY